MANNTNCEPCNITATVPVAPPPICPVPACDELVPTECVINNLLNDGCTSEFYQYDPADGSLILNQGLPVSQNPPIPLGLTISQGQSLHTILTNLVDAQNCMFQPNVIAGMLQVIQANPNHPVSQIFCNLVCSCVCDVPCIEDLTVEQVVFNPALTSVQFSFYAQTGVTYDFTFVNTTIVTPPQPPITYLGYTPTVGNQTVTLNTASLAGFPALQSGSNYQLFIRAYTSEGESCPNGSWFFTTDTDPACDCEDVVISLQFEGAVNCIDFDILLAIVPGQTVPLAYDVTITQGTTSPTTIYTGVVPITNPSSSNATPFSFGCGGVGLPNDTYTVYVQPICSFDPICVGVEIQETIEITGTVVCDPPTITGVAVA